MGADVTEPCEFIGFGAGEVTKPYEFIGFGARDVTKPYEFIGFGAVEVPQVGADVTVDGVTGRILPAPRQRWEADS